MPDMVGDWVALVHDRYPPRHAAAWDSVGLQVGDRRWPVQRVLVTLDVTTAVVTEAAANAPALILAHHPLLFRPLARLTHDTAAGKVALAAARMGVAVLAAHTNLDVARDGAGTSDPIMRTLGIDAAEPLTVESHESDELKLVTFVPPDHTERMLATLGGVVDGSGRSSFRIGRAGTSGQDDGAEPPASGADQAGGPGRAAGPGGRGDEEGPAETEDRLEIVMPRRQLAAAVRALLSAHPNEEVAYEVRGAEVGFGLVADSPKTFTLLELATRIRDELPAPELRFAGDPERRVRRIAAAGGAGESFIPAALAAGADVLVTGDLRHHAVLDALELGLALVDAGHHATEFAALPAWIERLRAEAARRGLEADLLASQVSTAPWSS
ncbi:MAG: Nif3-like dinuclear metal center hexameric protein [Actinomycetota bacterium]|nr:Nif3-like dinuclear metal center hexameric protein [Actinomycetota bacterium]